MKTTHTLYLLAIVAALLIAGCESDDGDERNKFLGRYEVEEQSLETYSPRDEYEVRIRREPGTDNMVIICNFYNYDVEVLATIDGNDIHVFPQVHNVFEFEGSGTLGGQIIVMTYTVTGVGGEGGYFDRLRAEMTLID